MPAPLLIDSHIHLNFPVLDANREKDLHAARQAQIHSYIVPATTAKSWPVISQLTAYPGVFAAYGLHPYFIDTHHTDDLLALDRYLSEHPAIAVGEIGLDFFLKDLDQTRQQRFFIQQLLIAQTHQLGVIIHARKAVEAITLTLKEHHSNGGIIHSYNGSLQQAHQLINMNFKLGFGGAITYPRARKLRDLVKKLPLDAIVLETDAPDQPPANWQASHNTPLGLIPVYQTVCELRNEPPETIAAQTSQNVHDVFPIIGGIQSG